MANPLVGQGDTGTGVLGTSNTGDGVAGNGNSAFGVFGSSLSGVGVRAVSEADRPALEAQAKGTGSGVTGTGGSGAGVIGTSNTNDGVVGISTSNFGVFGSSLSGVGVRAVSEADRPALEAQAKGTGSGVTGTSGSGAGVIGTSSQGGDGVFGISISGTGVHGKGKLAAFFEGDVKVIGDIRLSNGDCAEDFDIAGPERVGPGTVMVIDAQGALIQSRQAYDKRVAGVISGAGNFKPAIVLDKQESAGNRMPIALVGKVYCKVDAQYGPIGVGDLLASSPTPGHAMKADDPLKAFGAVIGKALRALDSGEGLIPVLIALQ